MTATATAARRPEATEFAPFYAGYVAGVPEGDIAEHPPPRRRRMRNGCWPSSGSTRRLSLRRREVEHQQVVGHMSDAERIFTYRALRIARGDQTPLAAFDENDVC